MEFIDTHCHLDLPVFNQDRQEVLRRAAAFGVHKIVVPAIECTSWDTLLDICSAENALYPALGLHPMFEFKHRESDLEELIARISTAQPVAIGEIGLDYYIPDDNRQRQIALLDAQLKIAASSNLPVLLHVRKAHDQVLQLLRKNQVTGGICHAFNGSLQQAWQYLDLGFKLGFGGMLTYERSKKLRNLARTLPLDSLVLETDAPDMTIASHQHQRNSPEYIPDIARTLAQLRHMDLPTVAAQTTQNALDVLRLDLA